MGISALTFIQELRALEVEISSLLASANSPEECPELVKELPENIRLRLTNLVDLAIRFVIVGHNTQLSTGEGENKKVSTGLPVVTELLVSSIINTLLRVVLQESGNLALNREVLALLHARSKIQDSPNLLPSETEKITNLLDTVSRMEDEFVRTQQQKAQELQQQQAATAQPAPDGSVPTQEPAPASEPEPAVEQPEDVG